MRIFGGSCTIAACCPQLQRGAKALKVAEKLRFERPTLPAIPARRAAGVDSEAFTLGGRSQRHRARVSHPGAGNSHGGGVLGNQDMDLAPVDWDDAILDGFITQAHQRRYPLLVFRCRSCGGWCYATWRRELLGPCGAAGTKATCHGGSPNTLGLTSTAPSAPGAARQIGAALEMVTSEPQEPARAARWLNVKASGA